MKKLAAIFLILCSPIFISVSLSQNDLASKVNTFIGTGGHGHTYPGASMPFGMVQLSPDTRLEGWDGCSGYHYSDSIIYGFTHTHLSGTGCSDYGDILLMPIVTENKFRIFDNKEYASKFSHSGEAAAPGYYRVRLDKFNILAELTVTPRTGFHRYTFPKTNQATIVLDLKHRDEVLDSYVTVVNDSTIKGLRRSKAWADDQYVYFYIQFSKPFNQYGIGINDELIRAKDGHGKNVKAFFTFDAGADQQVMAKVGISAVSEEGAKKNLETENPSWNFENVKADARAAWNKELGKIEIKGGTRDEQTVFYSALYHCFLNPNIYSDVDGNYRSTDLKIHKLTPGWKNCYTVFSLWDTFRALHPLLSIIDQQRTNDFINTFISEYEHGKILPVWELSANETFCMIGYHSVPVIVDAYMKGIRGFDAQKAFEAMKHSADTNLYGLECYRKFGFLGNDCEHESVSKTLEYAYDDWCIAQMAKALGKQDDYKTFIERAQSYKNVFDPATHFMRGRDGGMFHSPFNPAEVNNYYTEANSWQYTFFVPQDVSGLAALHGGKKNLALKLDDLFKAEEAVTGRDQPDITGLIGQYAQGNEPSHHIAYLYNYVDQPWKTQTHVYNICHEMYKNAPDGLCGNEDCGQMSAWYVMSAMGIYQVCPGSPQYAFGTPVFDKVSMHLENGRTFSIESINRSANSRYVETIELNNNPYSKSYISHDDIMKGGNVKFYMQEYIALETSKSNFDAPSTSITDDLIVPAPYADCNSKVFRGSQDVALKCADTTASIYFSKNNSKDYKLYTNSIEINEAIPVSFYAMQKDGRKSATIIASFLKIPDNRYITLETKYDDQYAAGGDEALIDGVRGDVNWRKGGWQGYPGRDIEATVDLGKIENVSKIGIGCLQDLSPWIFFPSEISFSVSEDNITYYPVGTIKPEAPDKNAPVETKNFSVNTSAKCRYIKVQARNFGKIPSWHESAGEPAWLFADEITVETK